MLRLFSFPIVEEKNITQISFPKHFTIRVGICEKYCVVASYDLESRESVCCIHNFNNELSINTRIRLPNGLHFKQIQIDDTSLPKVYAITDLPPDGNRSKI